MAGAGAEAATARARRSVFVRGVGAVTPLGPDWPSSRTALAEGASAIAPVTSFDATGFPSTVAAAVPERFCAGAHLDRRWTLLAPAADEAWRQAAVDVPAGRIGVFLGAESGRSSFATVVALARAAGGRGDDSFDARAFGAGAAALAPQLEPHVVSPAAVTSALARRLGAAGPAVTVSLACSSSAAAIAEGARSIRAGQCDVAVCGGVGADVDPLMLAGFGKLGALSARGRSCPFDVRRDGFVVGEGAAVIVLAVERGPARLELAGEARSLDAHHLTAPDPDGAGAERAMRGALADAGEARVDYLQAHGTSTPLNDVVEAAAIRRVLGRALDEAHVSSIKGAVGHAIAGAGALGFLAACAAILDGCVLPTAGLRDLDPACALPHVLGRALTRPVRTALVNAFAFGGANTSIVLRGVA
jgi:3-oxoacyl-[acyl-carrier-protein] synthase II